MLARVSTFLLSVPQPPPPSPRPRPADSAPAWPRIDPATFDESAIIHRVLEARPRPHGRPGMWRFPLAYPVHNRGLPEYLDPPSYRGCVRLINRARAIAQSDDSWLGESCAYTSVLLLAFTPPACIAAGVTLSPWLIALAAVVALALFLLRYRVSARCVADSDLRFRHVLRDINDSLQQGGNSSASDATTTTATPDAPPSPSLCSARTPCLCRAALATGRRPRRCPP